MSHEPLHEEVIRHIIKLYEQGFDAVDIYEGMDCRVSYDDVRETIQAYEEGEMPEVEEDYPEYDDFDDDYAYGSAGWGTDEFYE